MARLIFLKLHDTQKSVAEQSALILSLVSQLQLDHRTQHSQSASSPAPAAFWLSRGHHIVYPPEKTQPALKSSWDYVLLLSAPSCCESLVSNFAESVCSERQSIPLSSIDLVLPLKSPPAKLGVELSPLTEIQQRTSAMQGYDLIAKFAASLTAQHDNSRVHLLHLLKLRPDGAPSYAKYSHAMRSILPKYGGRVFVATRPSKPDCQWDEVFVVEYPNARACISMVTSDEYKAIKHFRLQGVEESVLHASFPVHTQAKIPAKM